VARELFDLIFRDVNHPRFIIYLGGIGDALEVHAGYQNLPEEVPNAGKFRDLARRLTEAVKAAQYGDRLKKAELDAIRVEGEEATIALANWAVIRYLVNKDSSLLANLGIAPKKAVVKNSNQVSVTAPQKVSAARGKLQGSVVLKASQMKGCASLEVQFCQGDPLQEASWSTGEHFPHCSHMELKGLEPGKIYHFRVRYLGNDGHGPWSAIVSLMVV
jgi:hypothetical protein